jgi:hypothetical protein
MVDAGKAAEPITEAGEAKAMALAERSRRIRRWRGPHDVKE